MYRQSSLSPRVIVTDVPRMTRWSGKKILLNSACVLFFLIVLFGFLVHSQQPSGPTGVITGWSDGITQNVVVSQTSTGKPVVTAKTVKVAPPAAKVLSAANASNALVRINQLDASEYDSYAQYTAWSPSTCSATSMTEVINSYGHHYTIGAILDYESSIGAITTELGLTYSGGIDATVKHFGFTTAWMTAISDDDAGVEAVVAKGNSGAPVIIGFPPAKWAGGHLLVVRGGATISGTRYVHLADSSSYNMQWMTYANFEKYWGGTAAVVTPA